MFQSALCFALLLAQSDAARLKVSGGRARQLNTHAHTHTHISDMASSEDSRSDFLMDYDMSSEMDFSSKAICKLHPAADFHPDDLFQCSRLTERELGAALKSLKQRHRADFGRSPSATALKDGLRGMFKNKTEFDKIYDHMRSVLFDNEEVQCPTANTTALKAVMLSGGPGAGKGSSTNTVMKLLKLARKDFVVIDPDGIRGALPQLQRMTCLRKTDDNCHAWEDAHKDCFRLAWWLHEIFSAETYEYAPRCNVLLDRVEIVGDNFNTLVDNGYQIAIIGVYRDLDEALPGIKARAAATCRGVPEEVARAKYKAMDDSLCSYPKYAEQASLGVHLIEGPSSDRAFFDLVGAPHNKAICDEQVLKKWDRDECLAALC